MWNWEVLEIEITSEGIETGILDYAQNVLWDVIGEHLATEDTFSFNWFIGSVDNADGDLWGVYEHWSSKQDVLKWATVGADYRI